jgi:hypothetical protein
MLVGGGGEGERTKTLVQSENFNCLIESFVLLAISDRNHWRYLHERKNGSHSQGKTPG